MDRLAGFPDVAALSLEFAFGKEAFLTRRRISRVAPSYFSFALSFRLSLRATALVFMRDSSAVVSKDKPRTRCNALIIMGCRNLKSLLRG